MYRKIYHILYDHSLVCVHALTVFPHLGCRVCVAHLLPHDPLVTPHGLPFFVLPIFSAHI